MTVSPDAPSEIDALRAALAAEQQARRQAEARAAGAEAMIAHLKLLIAKLRHDRFGASAERGRKLLDQLELELEELETDAGEVAAKREAEDATPVRPFTRQSSLEELTATRIGRLLNALLWRIAPFDDETRADETAMRNER